MIIIPKTQEEAERVVREILNQGDCRYDDIYCECLLATFLFNKSISLEKREAPSITKPKNFDFDSIKGKQKEEKYIGKVLLKKEGFEDKEILFEQSFCGSRADILATSKQKIVVVECCSCRVNKILEYLSFEREQINIEVWVLAADSSHWKNYPQNMQRFIFKKGKDFLSRLNKLNKIKLEEMRRALNQEHIIKN